MSESRSSIHLSEFFNDDDSEGHRFANFIKLRRGGKRKPNFLFMDCETESLSFNVQLEKLQSPQVKNTEILPKPQFKSCEATENAIRKENEAIVNNKLSQKASELKLPLDSPALDSFAFSKPLDLPVRTVSDNNNSEERHITSPIRSVRSKNSYICKSGAAFSPSDRLRRLSMINYSTKKLAGGRRTLLKEFENTIDGTNFNPPIFSTPVSQPANNVGPSFPNNNQSPEDENIEPNTANNPSSSNSNQSPDTENIELNIANKSITSETCCGHTDTLIKTLQRKDAELRDYMDSILDKTLKKIENQSKIVNENTADKTIVNKTNNCTTSKRTFTVEKGSVPGQIVLVHEKNSDGQNTRNSYLQCSTNKRNSVRKNLSTISRHSLKNCNKSDVQKKSLVNCSNCSISQSVSKTLQISHSSKQGQQETSLHEIQKENLEVPNSPQNINVSIVFPSHNIEIPDALNQTNVKEKTIIISSEQNFVALPLKKTISKVSNGERNNINIIESQNFQQAEDNLKLTDILTDDEEEAPKSALQSSQNTSEKPLNLAPNSHNFRKKRLRMRTSLKQKQHKDSQQQSSETETEIPPPAHSKRLLPKRKCKPLNRAPGTPLNGEKYAQELSRMSNYEILDLRKRNSMGKIFVISGRKSNRALEVANKKKLQLCNQIEQELLKRNLENISKNSINQSDLSNIKNVRPPAPNEFRDSLAVQEQTQNVSNDNCLMDEQSTDRIKFKDSENVRKKTGKKSLPQVLQQYLEVSRKYSTRKQRKSKSLKRSLFNTQDIWQTDEHAGSPEKTYSGERQSCSISKKLSMPFLKSPPETRKDLFTTPKVVSPPPIISNTSSEIEYTLHNIHTDVVDNSILPPPPPGFENDSSKSSNINNNNKLNNINQYSTNITVEAGEVTTTNASMQINLDKNNDNLFKKPTKPIPKRKVKQSSISSNIQLESVEETHRSINSSADLTKGGSLRRSKRGQVPICRAPIIDILYQQVMKKQEYYLEKNSRKKKQKIKNTLSTVSENDDVISICTSRGATLKEKRKERPKNTKNVKLGEKQVVSSNDNIEYSHLTLNYPQPVDHLNNVVDQLKENEGTENALSTVPERDDVLSNCTNQGTELEKKTKGRPTVKNARKQKKIVPSNDNLQYSHLTINFSPPVGQESKRMENILSTVPERYGALSICTSQGTELEKKTKGRSTKIKNARKQKKIVPSNDNLQYSQLPINSCPSAGQESKRMENTLSTVPERDGALSICTSQGTELENETKERSAKIKNNVKHKKIVPLNDNLQCSHLTLRSPPPVDHINNVFDQLKSSSTSNIIYKTISPQTKIKPLKIHVRRLKPSVTTPTTVISNVSSTSDFIKTNSNTELVAWLKNVGVTCNPDQPASEAINEMRISAATNLCFTELQGVEYAFYDTEEKASLGYLRFKPRQVKPRKRAKRFHLHFVNLMGEFRIKTNNGERILGVGDMVAIEKLAYYDIQNLTDDIGILMVIKK